LFIPNIKEENMIKEELVSLYKTKYKDTDDILEKKRSIVIHNSIIPAVSSFDGYHSVRATVINKSVLDGAYNYDVNYNPNRVLVKTIYNGYIYWDKKTIKDNRIILSDDLISKGYFRVSNAYTSYLGVWDYTYNEQAYEIAPMGVSMLDMVDLRNATRLNNNCIRIYGCTDMSMKLEVSFDGDMYETILPLPLPQFYSRRHSEFHREEPVITRIPRLNLEEICDEETKTYLVDFSSKDSNTDAISETSYLTADGHKLICQDSSNDSKQRVQQSCMMFRPLSDELFMNIFKYFTRYQLSSLDFVYDSGWGNKFKILSSTFSYSNPPSDFAKGFMLEMLTNKDICDAFINFKSIFSDMTIIGRLTDLRYDIIISFKNGHQSIRELKSIKYRTSVVDLLSSLTNTETSISKPITSLF